LIAITGTPGTGKTSACEVLASRGYPVRTVLDLAKKYKVAKASKGGDFAIDTDRLKGKLGDLRGKGAMTIVDGHLSHCLGADVCIVVRCSPALLESRLEARGYPKQKVRDNVEAEAIDLVLVEAIENCDDTFEIDATEKSAEDVANDIERILNGETRHYEPGKVDWSGEVLSWY